MAADEKQVLPKKKHLQLQGGYECIFIKDPPDHLQTECSICLCVLREPYLVDCCGYSFCKSCIEPIKSEHKTCPLCAVQFTQLMPDKRLQRTLNDLQVYCSHREGGCEWEGRLSDLSQHLNTEPLNDTDRLSGCLITSIECVHCHGNMQRQELEEHENSCLQRPYTCDHCDYTSTYEDVTLIHGPTCSFRPVNCPNNCGESPRSQLLDNHLMNECPLEVIDCAFSYVGCRQRLPRREMSEHIRDSLVIHMTLQATSHQQELKRLNSEVNELKLQLKKVQEQSSTQIANLQRENQLLLKKLEVECKNRMTTVGQEIKKAQNQRLKAQLTKLRGEIKRAQIETNRDISENVQVAHYNIHNHIGLVPISFTMSHFEQNKAENTIWYSPTFYTHPRGYKMCLRINANGRLDGENTHVSVFLHMMKGEHDEYLHWPFRGNVTVNQSRDEEHYLKNIVLDELAADATGRLVSRQFNMCGCGLTKFIPHKDLRPKFLKNDCLKISIKEVNVSYTVM